MPRKSTESNPAQAKAEDDGGSASKPSKADHKGLSVEELNLPRSMVQRLAKGMLPLNTSIQKDALLALSKSATVFVNYLASNANDRAVLNNKKTIQPADVFAALNELEFPGFIPRVRQELDLYNKEQCDKRNNYRKRIREEQLSSEAGKATEDSNGGERNASEGGNTVNGNTALGNGSAHVNGDRRTEDEAPAFKKARLSSGAVHPDDDNALNDENDEDGDTIDDDAGDDDDALDAEEADEEEDDETDNRDDVDDGDAAEDESENAANDATDDADDDSQSD